ncbi:cytochrome P450 1A5-like [Petromyzon marinus]|uniref:unspecific monooxygenase n=1 Tax=Petromyzon marinus TaxID=7757 RepID=A0AAJ7U4K0_PETMA|nr:cytochrome P450 1A5-like [Petromyzon marinus]
MSDPNLSEDQMVHQPQQHHAMWPITVQAFLLLLSAFFLALAALQKKRAATSPSTSTPPPSSYPTPRGPFAWPLVGNAMELGSAPHVTLARWSKVYGDVMKIQIGSRPVVVLSGLETIRQALVRQGDSFAGRPKFESFSIVGNGLSLAFNSTYGPTWKAHKRMAQGALRAFSEEEARPSTGTSTASASMCALEEHAASEAAELVRIFLEGSKAATGAAGGTAARGSGVDGPRPPTAKAGFDAVQPLALAVANVITALLFGKRYAHDDEELAGIVALAHDFVKVTAAGNISDFVPAARLLLPSCRDSMRRFTALNHRFSEFIRRRVSEHHRAHDKSNMTDVTSWLISLSQDSKFDENGNVEFPLDKVASIVSDFLGAGFDTISTTLSWSMLYLAAYPDTQERIHRELDAVVGRQRRPSLNDRRQLPFTEAFILEVLRHSSVVPFTIPHSTTRDTVLQGFFIPKDTCIFINQWQVNHDSALWDEPFAFRPERFLSEDQSSVDRTRAANLLSFGTGKRRCMGEAVARSELFLFLSILLHHLRIRTADGQAPDMSAVYGLSLKHRTCLLLAESRS